MTARTPIPSRRTVACANPVCSKRIGAAQPLALTLTQPQSEGVASWTLCSLECLQQYLTLCLVKARAAEEVTS